MLCCVVSLICRGVCRAVFVCRMVCFCVVYCVCNVYVRCAVFVSVLLVLYAVQYCVVSVLCLYVYNVQTRLTRLRLGVVSAGRGRR